MSRAVFAMGIAVLAAVAGCLDTVLDLPPTIEILGVSPSADVPEDARITLAFSGPVHAGGDWPIEVLRDGQALPIAVEPSASAALISPAPRWPAGARLEVAVGRGLSDDLGRKVAEGRAPFSVRAREVSVLPAVVRSPTPGTRAPANLGWVAVALGADNPAEAALESGAQRIALGWERSAEGVALFRLPDFESECRPLCPGETYRVAVDGRPASEGPLGRIETGTVADVQAPGIVATKVVFRGGQPWVEILRR